MPPVTNRSLYVTPYHSETDFLSTLFEFRWKVKVNHFSRFEQRPWGLETVPEAERPIHESICHKGAVFCVSPGALMVLPRAANVRGKIFLTKEQIGLPDTSLQMMTTTNKKSFVRKYCLHFMHRKKKFCHQCSLE